MHVGLSNSNREICYHIEYFDMKQLIVNADDFGMSEEVNDGIKRGIEAGVITSVSIMVNMPFFEDAVKYLKIHPDIPVGLHFNLTEGSPVSVWRDVSTLIREDGNFYYWTNLLSSIFTRKIEVNQIKKELTSQYEKLKKSGIPINHIDSHHHIHLYPEIFRTVAMFAQNNNIHTLRSRSFQLDQLFFLARTRPTLKQFIILALCSLDSLLYNFGKKFAELDSLYDISWDQEKKQNKFFEFLKNLPDGITEIICHPAVLSNTGNPKFLKPRYDELTLLLSRKTKKTIKENNIQLIGKVDSH